MVVVRLMITEMGFAPRRLSVGGYGEFHPVAPNTTAEQRALNRRVDVVILRRSIDAATPTASADSSEAADSAMTPPSPRVVPALPGTAHEGKPSPAHAAPKVTPSVQH